MICLQDLCFRTEVTHIFLWGSLQTKDSGASALSSRMFYKAGFLSPETLKSIKGEINNFPLSFLPFDRFIRSPCLPGKCLVKKLPKRGSVHFPTKQSFRGFLTRLLETVMSSTLQEKRELQLKVMIEEEEVVMFFLFRLAFRAKGSSIPCLPSTDFHHFQSIHTPITN